MRHLIILALLLSIASVQAIAGVNYFRPSVEYHKIGSAVVSSAPMTVSMWISKGEVADHNIWAAGVSGSNSNYFAMQALEAPQRISLRVQDGAGGTAISIAGTFVVGQWNHVAAQIVSPTERYVWCDGSKSAKSAVSRVPAGVDYMAIGVRDGVALAAPMGGRIARVVVWSVALLDHEIIALSKGVNPKTIRPEADTVMVSYYVMDGDGPAGTVLRDVVGGNHMTVVGGTPTKTDSPPQVLGFTIGSYTSGNSLLFVRTTARCREEDYALVS